MLPYTILFLCTYNAARSIVAEAWVNTYATSLFRAYSAGSNPRGQVHPLAIECAVAMGYPTECLRSKSWDEFSGAQAMEVDFVITVCDSAAGETCPLWLGNPTRIHWGFPDPSYGDGSDDEKRLAFQQLQQGLAQKFEVLLALPMETLDRKVLAQAMKELSN